MLKKIQEWDFFVIFWLIISDLCFLSSFCFWRELIAEVYYYLDTRRFLWPDEMIQNVGVLVLFALCTDVPPPDFSWGRGTFVHGLGVVKVFLFCLADLLTFCTFFLK